MITSNLQPFHLAILVNNLKNAKEFYGDLMGFKEGRSSEKWIDWDFFGHQLVTHLNPDYNGKNFFNSVDGHGVPVPHFGVVLTWENWQILAERLQNKNIKFVIEPYIRFKDQVGEQATMFFYDPFGNALEFKAFKDISKLFVKY